MPRCFVGLPFVNNLETLPLAVKSVLAQSMDDWELVLVDDGSSDGSLKWARSLSDPRISVVSDGESRGLAARLNQLTTLASSDIVVRMDADDAMHPERLRMQVETLESDVTLDLIGSAAYVMTADEDVYGLGGTAVISADIRQFLRNRVIVHPTVAARRTWMFRNPYDEGYLRAQDKELFCRAHPHSRFFNLPDPLLFYREVGQFRLNSYRAQRKADRRLTRAYGPSRMGWPRTSSALSQSVLKEAAYVAASRFGLERSLHRRVSERATEPLSAQAIAAAQTTLNGLRAVHLPVGTADG